MSIHFSPEDLQTLDAEPRVHDLRLAEALGFERPRTIRQLIERNLAELETHGEVCCTAQQTSSKGGRPTQEYWLNEAQALLICMFSRTQNAAEVRRALVEVFMAWRHSQLPEAETLALPAAQSTLPVPVMQINYSGEFSGETTATVNVKIALLRQIERLFGKPAACTAYHRLGLPAV